MVAFPACPNLGQYGTWGGQAAGTMPASFRTKAPDTEREMVKDLIVAFFAVAAGFTVSGIVANSYKLVTREHELSKLMWNVPLMAVAGPNVIFGQAATSLRARNCSSLAFCLATAITGYWSFVLGLFLLDVLVTVIR